MISRIEIERLLLSGISQTEVAKLAGCTRQWIWQISREIKGYVPPGKCTGTQVGSAKITEEDVVIMRKLYRDNSMTTGELSRIYGISVPAVCNALRGKTWSHVPGPVEIRGGRC